MDNREGRRETRLSFPPALCKEAHVSVTIRAANPADAGPIAGVHVDSWRTTYEGIVPAEYLANLSYRDRESMWHEALTTDQLATSIFVAETEGGGDIVGFASAGPERERNSTYQAELYAIYLLQEHQTQGLGRRLVSAVANSLLAHGINSMLLWVLEDNRPACRFYESLGGDPVGRKTVTIGGADLQEVSYGWSDIAALAVGCPCHRRIAG